MGAEGAGDPLDRAALFHQRTLGIQVVHVLRPVFNRRIPQRCIFANIQFHTASVQICDIIFRCRTAFNKVQVCTLFYNNQGMFKLSSTLCIQSEIGLQRNRYGYILRNIYKRTARPNCTVQGCKFMVSWRN